MALLQAYFDESGSHDGSPVLCVAGYLFEKDQCGELDLGWKRTLDRYELPFFHMVDCAHGNPPFDKLSRDERIAVETELIGLIRSHALLGVGAAVVESEYEEIFPLSDRIALSDSPSIHLPGTPYTYCCWTALAAIYAWIMASNFDGEIVYFFEAGHKHGNEANAIMSRIFKAPQLRSEYRYAAHSFVHKEKVRPIQAADLIAWQHATDLKKILTGKPRRKDYAALIDGRHVDMKLIRRENLLLMRRQLDALKRGAPVITGMFGSQHFTSIG